MKNKRTDKERDTSHAEMVEKAKNQLVQLAITLGHDGYTDDVKAIDTILTETAELREQLETREMVTQLHIYEKSLDENAMTMHGQRCTIAELRATVERLERQVGEAEKVVDHYAATESWKARYEQSQWHENVYQSEQSRSGYDVARDYRREFPKEKL